MASVQRWQHYARLHNVTEDYFSISYFNNFASAPDNGSRPSNGLELQLSLPPSKSNSPRIIRYLSDPLEVIYADSQGSTQFLANGDVFLDYGQIPVMKEYGAANSLGGAAKWTARFGQDNQVQSYRGFKQEWRATPTYPPNLVLRKDHGPSGCAIGYVSWNGATSVSAWEIWETGGHGNLEKAGRVGFRGFETKFGVKGSCAQAVALAGEKVIGKSNLACVS